MVRGREREKESARERGREKKRDTLIERETRMNDYSNNDGPSLPPVYLTITALRRYHAAKIGTALKRVRLRSRIGEQASVIQALRRLHARLRPQFKPGGASLLQLHRAQRHRLATRGGAARGGRSNGAIVFPLTASHISTHLALTELTTASPAPQQASYRALAVQRSKRRPRDHVKEATR